jgi:hypothetical protein
MIELWDVVGFVVAALAGGLGLGFVVGRIDARQQLAEGEGALQEHQRAAAYAEGAHDGMAAAGLMAMPPLMLTDQEMRLVRRVGEALTQGPVH